MRDRFGATNPKAQALRFHAQTGGSTLTAQQPENNIVRVAVQALAAVCGGAQSVHTNSYDEALALPTEHAATIALRTQQILQHEAGDDATGRSARRLLLHRGAHRRARPARLGADRAGPRPAVPSPRSRRASCRERSRPPPTAGRRLESGERVIVGVNKYAADVEAPIELHRIDPEGERRQCERTAAVRAGATRSCRARRSSVSARRRSAPGTCCRRCATRSRRTARSARSAACSVRSGASSTGRASSACGSCSSPRCIRGPPTPTSARSSRFGVEALRERGHEVDLAVLDRRAGGSGGFSSCGGKVQAAPRPDVMWAHFLVPAGLLATEVDAPLVVTAHGRDVHNIGSIPGVAALTRRVVTRASTVIAVSNYLRRELEEKLPRHAARPRSSTRASTSRVRRRHSCDWTRAARVRLRRRAQRAQERDPAGRRVRGARPRLAHLCR